MKKNNFDLNKFCTVYDLDLVHTADVLGIILPTPEITTITGAKKIFAKSREQKNLKEANRALENWLTLISNYEEMLDCCRVISEFQGISQKNNDAVRVKRKSLVKALFNQYDTVAKLRKLYESEKEGCLQFSIIKKMIKLAKSKDELEETFSLLRKGYDSEEGFDTQWKIIVGKLAKIHGCVLQK